MFEVIGSWVTWLFEVVAPRIGPDQVFALLILLAGGLVGLHYGVRALRRRRRTRRGALRVIGHVVSLTETEEGIEMVAKITDPEISALGQRSQFTSFSFDSELPKDEN